MEQRRYWLARLALCCGIVLLLSCTSNKRPVTRLVLQPGPAIVPVSAPAEPGPELKETPPVVIPPPPALQERVDLLIIQGREAMDKGKALAREGKLEEARKNFQLALDDQGGLTAEDLQRLDRRPVGAQFVARCIHADQT